MNTVLPAPSETKALSSLRLGAPFRGRMVLQRDRAVPVFGWAPAGARIEARFAGRVTRATALEDGRWRALFPALPAGLEGDLTVRAGEASVVVREVVTGDVWLCAGQSNMQIPVRGASAADVAETRGAQDRWLRLGTVARRASRQPEEQAEIEWRACTPQTALDFSAVAFAFGQEIRRSAGVPVGLLLCAFGGSPIEAWMPLELLLEDERFRAHADRRGEWEEREAENQAAFAAEWQAWLEQGQALAEAAPCRLDGNPHDLFFGSAGRGSPWRRKLGGYRGVVWYAKTVDLPPSAAAMDWTLHADALEAPCWIYVNGSLVGKAGAPVPETGQSRLAVRISRDLLREGENRICFRLLIFHDNPHSGAVGGAAEMSAVGEAGQQRLVLGGDWHLTIEPRLPRKPKMIGAPKQRAGYLYNGMIHPLLGSALRGVLWYQGESNSGDGDSYRALLPAMMRRWRELWEQEDLPFYIVQLAGYRSHPDEPGESALAMIRDAQAHAAMEPHVHLATAVDLGEADDIHPSNKREVGLRLARLALAHDYREEIAHENPGAVPRVACGPEFRSLEVEGGRIRLFFDHLGSGLVWNGGGRERAFAIADAGGSWWWAQAEISRDGCSVTVWHPDIPRPAWIRYAWADHPCTPLYNRENLPAFPFQARVAPS